MPHGAYIDYLYFSIETLSTAGYGDMHPQTHYGHFIATVELFTGIFSMSLMTGLIFARFSRPSARLLFANNPVISNHEGEPTLMVRFANERHNIISNATAKLWLLQEHRHRGRPSDCGALRTAAVAQREPGLRAELDAVSRDRRAQPALRARRRRTWRLPTSRLIVVVSGYDVVAAQTVHARKTYEHADILFGQRYVDVLQHLGRRPGQDRLRQVP